LDTHVVRTLPETVLVVVGPDLRVRRVEVLAFKAPRDYLPSDRWLAQFDGVPLDDDTALKRRIRVLSGATLSSRAITRAVRRVLAVVELELAGQGADR
ncbi:MAG: FMN-binding protein, partial [Acidobacteria bacterium]